MIERLSGSSCPSVNDEPEFQELKNKDEEQNHVDHVRYSAAECRRVHVIQITDHARNCRFYQMFT